MKTTLCLVLASAFSIIAGAALGQAAPDATTSAGGASSTAAPVATDTSPIPAPPDGKGQIVFYRPWNYAGAADWIKIRENGQELGKLYGNRYFVQVADPGMHAYTVAMETTDTLKLEVDPGETYYVEARIGMGIMLARFSLAAVDGSRFAQLYPHMKLAPAPHAPPPPKPEAAASATQ